LDITEWQKERLKSMDLNSVGDVLRATETKLREAYYVGEKRARRMRNAAIAAVYEYLLG
jgi:ERCC4-type nuclease